MAGFPGNIALPAQLLFSFGLGTAAGPALEPYAQSLANEAWASHAVLPPDAIYLAQGVAQGQVAKADAYSWAKQQGFDTAQMDALVSIANVGPQLGYAYQAWRRGLLTDAQFQTALRRTGLEPQWFDALEGLHDELLSSPELAMAQQQGFVDLARSNSEALLQGVTPERQQIRFAMSGLPPGIETGLQMLRRGIIDQPTFARIVREGHTKTKYTDVLTQLERQLLSPATAVRARLKGHIDTAAMHARGADWGYTPGDMDLWYLSEGRPATAHQIHIGYARGASLPGAADERDAISIATKQSDIRPEYEGIIYAGRATYPALFQLNRLVSAGAITPAIAAEWATKSGEAQEVVAVLETYWKGLGTTSAGDPHVAKAQTQLWTTTHRSYVAEEIDNATATTAIEAAGVAAGSTSAVLSLWAHERSLVRKQLSPAQIKKARNERVINPATGAPWTDAEALAALVARGYDQADATTLLEL